MVKGFVVTQLNKVFITKGVAKCIYSPSIISPVFKLGELYDYERYVQRKCKGMPISISVKGRAIDPITFYKYFRKAYDYEIDAFKYNI